jgi:hypothetical protein
LNLIEDDVYIGSNSIKNIDRLSFKKIILKNLKKSYITPEDSIKSLLIFDLFFDDSKKIIISEKYMNILYVLGLISNFELKLKIIPITIENLLLIKIINYLEMLELEKFKIISICNWILDNEFFDEN